MHAQKYDNILGLAVNMIEEGLHCDHFRSTRRIFALMMNKVFT